jgi:hypothetical protein
LSSLIIVVVAIKSLVFVVDLSDEIARVVAGLGG